MKPILVGAFAMLAAASTAGMAQSLEDLNIQIHGYANQNFLYTTNNNIFTTSSSNGSPQWTEAVVNVSSTPKSGLRIAVQARYQLLGTYANGITIDYAAADYKVNEKFGVRFGKVKIPSGLFNEIQDIDPSYQWALLPQGVYPLSSRNGQLSLYGGVGYGSLALPSKLGKLEYRAWGGEVVIAGNDGYFTSFTEEGINFTNGVNAVEQGGALHWKTPLHGLMVGLSDIKTHNESGALTTPYGPATFLLPPNNHLDYFAQYEKNKLMIAGEYSRLEGNYKIQFGGPATPYSPYDGRAEYVMATYKVTEKFAAGVYESQSNSHSPATPLGPAKYSKDLAISTRYDFNQYLYAKAEEHVIHGTSIGYDTALNPGGLQPNTDLTVLKMGVTF